MCSFLVCLSTSPRFLCKHDVVLISCIHLYLYLLDALESLHEKVLSLCASCKNKSSIPDMYGMFMDYAYFLVSQSGLPKGVGFRSK
jgi:hypothetical protein